MPEQPDTEDAKVAQKTQKTAKTKKKQKNLKNEPALIRYPSMSSFEFSFLRLLRNLCVFCVRLFFLQSLK
jgi:hypothetical protein